MKDILNSVTTLDGFMGNDQVTSIIKFADDRELDPPICGKYNGPDQPDDPNTRTHC